MRSASARRLVIAVTLAEQQQAAGLFERRTECSELFSGLTEIFGPAVQHPLAATGDRRTPFRLAEVGLRGDLGDHVGGLVDGADREQRLEQIALVPQVAGVEHLGMQSVDATKVIGGLGVAARRQRHMAECRQAKRLEHSHPDATGAGDGHLGMCCVPSTCARALLRPWPGRPDRTTPSADRECR